MKNVQAIIQATGHDWALTGEHVFHIKVENRPWLDLHIEGIGTNPSGHQLISVAHYGESNGDLMADPEVTFAVVRFAGDRDGLAWKWVPLEYRNDWMGARLRCDRAFPAVWDKNIKDQGFVDAAIQPKLREIADLPSAEEEDEGEEAR